MQYRGAVSAPEHPWERLAPEPAPAASLGIDAAVLVPWFGITAELLGDVIRLAWHWHETDRRREAAAAHTDAAAAAAAASSDGLQDGSSNSADTVGMLPRQGGFSQEFADRLIAADWALCRLAQAMDHQVAAAGNPIAGHSAMHHSHSNSSIGEVPSYAAAGAGPAPPGASTEAGGVYGAAAGTATGPVDMVASMEALAVRLLMPPPDTDKLFAVMLMHRDHVLAGGRWAWTLEQVDCVCVCVCLQ